MNRRLALAALIAACSKHSDGESCDDNGDCAGDLVCLHDHCMSNTAAVQKLNEMSGVGAPPGERPAVGGDPIRVRKTSGQGRIFAACDAGERLISGGCSGGYDCGESGCSYMRGWPSDYSETDTLGARWWCEATGKIEAYALCQTHAGSGSGSGSGLRAP